MIKNCFSNISVLDYELGNTFFVKLCICRSLSIKFVSGQSRGYLLNKLYEGRMGPLLPWLAPITSQHGSSPTPLQPHQLQCSSAKDTPAPTCYAFSLNDDSLRSCLKDTFSVGFFLFKIALLPPSPNVALPILLLCSVFLHSSFHHEFLYYFPTTLIIVIIIIIIFFACLVSLLSP